MVAVENCVCNGQEIHTLQSIHEMLRVYSPGEALGFRECLLTVE